MEHLVIRKNSYIETQYFDFDFTNRADNLKIIYFSCLDNNLGEHNFIEKKNHYYRVLTNPFINMNSTFNSMYSSSIAAIIEITVDSNFCRFIN